MNQLLNQITPILTTAFIAVIVAMVGYVGKEVVKIIPLTVDHIVAKIGLTKYKQMKLIGLDVWNIIEEDSRLNKLVGDKITAFETVIKQKVPGITESDIKTLRQAIAGEINKDKPVVVKAVEYAPIVNVVPVTPVTPVIKYVAPDGTELQPVSANNALAETAAQ